MINGQNVQLIMYSYFTTTFYLTLAIKLALYGHSIFYMLCVSHVTIHVPCGIRTSLYLMRWFSPVSRGLNDVIFWILIDDIWVMQNLNFGGIHYINCGCAPCSPKFPPFP